MSNNLIEILKPLTFQILKLFNVIHMTFVFFLNIWLILSLRLRNDSKVWILYSRYLAQNAAIWLADEVLRYRDHDTSRCQDDISWHLITQQSKGRNANNESCIVAKKGDSTHIYYERYQC